ncbi:probable quinolone resistance protein NorA at N-terminal half [Coccomyxa sp. Obi]|nr:probable quinolone resistance protein NorA at N-terminal half [Coccomyxa sp. Obi]
MAPCLGALERHVRSFGHRSVRQDSTAGQRLIGRAIRRRPSRSLLKGVPVCTAFRDDARTAGHLFPKVAPYHLETHQTQNGLAKLVVRVLKFLAENERLLVVAASTMIMSLSHTALRPVLPTFAKSFGVGAAAVGSTISVYAIARLMMNLPAGMLADRYGRKPLLVWGPLITALGMIGCGMSGTFGQLLAWRWVTGIGSALQMAGAQLFLTDISLSTNRARTLGTNQAASLMGGLVGPAVGGLLADAAGLRAPFTLTGCAALAAAVYGWVRLPETMGLRARAATDAAVAAAEPAASRASQAETLQAETSGAEEAAKEQPPDLAVSGQQITAVKVADAAVDSLKENSTYNPRRMRPKRRKERPSWLLLLQSRDFGAIALVNALMFATANGSRSVLMPLLATQSFAISNTVLGLLYALMAVIALVGIMPAAFVADKLGRKWTIVPSCFGLAGSLLLMAVTGRQELFIGAMMLYAVANSCIGATPAAFAADVMPQSVSGFGLGMFRCAGDIGLMVGPALLGWIADMTSVQTALQVNAVVLVAAVSYFGLAARETKHLRVQQHMQKRAAAAAAAT